MSNFKGIVKFGAFSEEVLNQEHPGLFRQAEQPQRSLSKSNRKIFNAVHYRAVDVSQRLVAIPFQIG